MGALRGNDRVLLYILNCGNLYGTERMALATLEGLDEYADRVILAPKSDAPETVAAAARQAGFTALSYDSRAQFVRKMVSLFMRYRAVDILGTGVGQTYICHVLAKILRVRMRQLQIVHGGMEDWTAYGRKRKLNQLPVRVVAVSDFVRRKLVDNGVRDDAICVINNFLSDDQGRSPAPMRPPYDPAVPGARPIYQGAIRVAVVSRMEPVKRVDLLIEAVERSGMHEFTFDVYGAGTELARLRERSGALANIRFHGFVPNAAERLADADVLLHLCPSEPFGLVILEAFRSRLLVVAPDAGGVSSIVDDAATGFRYKADDPDDMARVLRAACALDGARLQRIADAGLDAVRTRYSLQEGVRRYREVLRAA